MHGWKCAGIQHRGSQCLLLTGGIVHVQAPHRNCDIDMTGGWCTGRHVDMAGEATEHRVEWQKAQGVDGVRNRRIRGRQRYVFGCSTRAGPRCGAGRVPGRKHRSDKPHRQGQNYRPNGVRPHFIHPRVQVGLGRRWQTP